MPKFLIKAPRYIDGVYIAASPDFPAVIDIEIPEGRKPDAGLHPLDTPKDKPHYAPTVGTTHKKATELHSTPVAEQGKAKRPNDKDV